MRNIETVAAEWQSASAAAKDASALEIGLRKELIEVAFGSSLTREGTKRVPLDEETDVCVNFKQNYNLANRDDVDEALTKIEAIDNAGKFIAERLVTFTPKLSLSEYRKLEPKYKRAIDEVLTITPGLPAVEIASRKKGR